jgi:hypothetical protein
VSSGAVLVSHDRNALEDPARLRTTRLITADPSPANRVLPSGRPASNRVLVCIWLRLRLTLVVPSPEVQHTLDLGAPEPVLLHKVCHPSIHSSAVCASFTGMAYPSGERQWKTRNSLWSSCLFLISSRCSCQSARRG